MNLKKIIPFIFTLLAVASCRKSETKPAPIVDVYVAGYTGDETTGLYWKDTVSKSLTASPQVAHAIVAKGHDIYIAGTAFSQVNQDYVAVYWKNGVVRQVNSGTMQHTEGQAIAVQDTNVYIAGTIGGNAAYWKNGTITRLTDNFSSNYAYGIAVSGNDVYVSGGMDLAVTYWKNGVANQLTDGSSFAVSSGIAVNGSDVYVSGYAEAANGIYVATYWKNGIAVKLSDSTSDAEALAIAIKGKDVYVVGESGTNSIATYWKNGVATQLTDGSAFAQVNAITFNGNDVYMAGYIGQYAAYWKNGAITKLSGGISEGLGIAVVQR